MVHLEVAAPVRTSNRHKGAYLARIIAQSVCITIAARARLSSCRGFSFLRTVGISKLAFSYSVEHQDVRQMSVRSHIRGGDFHGFALGSSLTGRGTG